MMQEVRKTVTAPAVTLQVDPLPTPKPDGFSGAVGKFTMKSSLTPQSLNANDATTLRITINGTGNMKLMNAPVVAWPKDFESYDPRTEEKTRISAAGSTGQVVYDYIALPRHQGKYELPAPEFIYFDPAERAYKTLRGDAYTIDVAKGKGGGSVNTNYSKEDVELLASDIRYIKTSDAHYQAPDSDYLGSPSYWGAYAGLLAAFLGIVVIFRRYAIANADLARRRTRGASKVATKRLKAARKLLAQGNANAMYEETMRALWGYLADKLNIPVSELTKDNVRERLNAQAVAPEFIDAYLRAIDDCEFARFAPGDPASMMQRVYAQAEQAIENLNDLKI